MSGSRKYLSRQDDAVIKEGYSMGTRRFLGRAIVAFEALLLFAVQQVHAQERNTSPTAIPAIFSHSIDSSKAKAGDTVIAKTIQVVKLADGTQVPKGSVII